MEKTESEGSGKRIITHAGGAHPDEVVSTALLLAANPSIDRIERVKEVADADLASDQVYVLDIGRHHEPARLNFDHHQFAPDAPPRCTLSLVLDHLGLFNAAERCWPWLASFVLWDVSGPAAVAQSFGNPEMEAAFPALASPIGKAVIGIISDIDYLHRDDPTFNMLHAIGQNLLDELRELPALIDWYAAHVTGELGAPPSVPVRRIIVTEHPPGSRSLASRVLELFQKEQVPNARLLVTPDERGGGWALRSISAREPIDFRFLSGDPEVIYIHNSGFLAVTKSPDPGTLKRILKQVDQQLL